MKILGIDTSSPSGSVALLNDNRVEFEKLLDGSPAFSDKLLTGVDAVLNHSKTNLNEFECMVQTQDCLF